MDTSLAGKMLLIDLCFGYLLTSAIYVAAELRIADHLAAGPLSAAELSPRVGADPQCLYRVLRALASKGVFAEDRDGRFHLTPPAESLRSDTPGSFRDAVLMCTLAPTIAAGAQLLHSVRTGQAAFAQVHDSTYFEYLAGHPELGIAFDKGMAAWSEMENATLAASYDFAPSRRVVDVGGGRGGFLREVLKRYSAPRGIVLDQPHVIAEIAADSVAAGRCELVGGDFFKAVPAGADVYVVKRILHDWGDEACVSLLRRCREAMAAGGRVLVIDAVIQPGNDDDPGKVMDLVMMALLAGRERTSAEFAALLAAAGLRLVRVIPTATTLCILEAAAA